MNQPIAVASFIATLKAQMISECDVMLRYALSNGKELPQLVMEELDVLDQPIESGVGLTLLAGLHSALLRVVAPATPAGLAWIEEDRRTHRLLHTFGPVPSIRYLMAAALVFSVIFFATSLSKDINIATIGQDIFNSSGPQLAWVLVFLLSASGLGATFGALFDAYQYISQGSYDTKFDSIYWARIGLGLVSGLMLAELIPQAHGDGAALERPLLALCGGFSAAVVHQILDRLVGALGSVFVPTAHVDPASTERAIRHRVAEESSQQRTSLTKSFDQLLDHVASGGNVDDARKGLVALLSGRSGALGSLGGKMQQIAVDAALGFATGGLRGAEQRAIADITDAGGAAGPNGGMVAGAVLSKGKRGALGAVVGSVGQPAEGLHCRNKGGGSVTTPVGAALGEVTSVLAGNGAAQVASAQRPGQRRDGADATGRGYEHRRTA